MRDGAAETSPRARFARAIVMTRPPARPRTPRRSPRLFVVLWSTGFIAAKYGLPYAPPFTFLVLRFVLATALLAVVALAMRAPWPKREELVHLAIAASLVHGCYLAGVWIAIKDGMAAGTSAMSSGCSRSSPSCSRGCGCASACCRASGPGLRWGSGRSTSSCATR
jgi:hypothetical protein